MPSTAYASQTTTDIAVTDLENAISAIKTYCSAADEAYKNLKAEVDNLQNSNLFVGEASAGYRIFVEKLSPNLTTNLADLSNPQSLMASLISILEAVRDSVNGSLDPSLGSQNQTLADGSAA